MVDTVKKLAQTQLGKVLSEQHDKRSVKEQDADFQSDLDEALKKMGKRDRATLRREVKELNEGNALYLVLDRVTRRVVLAGDLGTWARTKGALVWMTKARAAKWIKDKRLDPYRYVIIRSDDLLPDTEAKTGAKTGAKTEAKAETGTETETEEKTLIYSWGCANRVLDEPVKSAIVRTYGETADGGELWYVLQSNNKREGTWKIVEVNHDTNAKTTLMGIGFVDAAKDCDDGLVSVASGAALKLLAKQTNTYLGLNRKDEAAGATKTDDKATVGLRPDKQTASVNMMLAALKMMGVAEVIQSDVPGCLLVRPLPIDKTKERAEEQVKRIKKVLEE